jgi:hypothetical protein
LTASQVASAATRRLRRRSRRKASGALLAIPVFFLTVAGGLTFLQLVLDSHFYHEFVERAFFGKEHHARSYEEDQGRASWLSSLRAADMRKIGHVIDTFEPSVLGRLTDNVRSILEMPPGEDRSRALAKFSALVKTNRSDFVRMTLALKSLRESGLEGAEVEFVDVDNSLARLKQTSDILTVMTLELDTGADDVTLHGIQKQLSDTIEGINAKPDPGTRKINWADWPPAQDTNNQAK